MSLRYEKIKSLFGIDGFHKISNAKVIILGVGGVGGFALDCLYRSGLTNITIVDFDIFDETNQNRQIGSDVIGVKKVTRLKSLYPNIDVLDVKIDKEWVESFDMRPYDLIVDAIDDIDIKVMLIEKYYSKLVSTSGSANRIDPMQIEYIDIYKTYNDPFIKKIRTKLKQRKFNKRFKIIFSKELPSNKDMGSFVGVTGTFGLSICSVVIKKLLS